MFEILSISFLFLCVVLFMIISLIAMLSYRNGLKDGINIAKNKEMLPLENPNFTLFSKKEPKEEEKQDIISEGMNNLMTYDGNFPK